MKWGINAPLSNLHKQITGCWLKYANIILSCRLNVWEAGNNHLHEFEVYRNRDFFDSEQRNQFIKNYFEKNPTLGEQLITELNQEVTERIQDLVKNPLRLTMICFSWHKNKGKLPDTKAELYQEYVDAFYDWKADEVFSTTPTERRELNQALGELAKNALEQDSAWFLITHQQICQYLSNPKEEGLGKKAIELGWLNQVGVSEQNSDNEVYAFFHPSFQEYFAALAIDNWTFFFHHNPNNLSNGIYKIFDKIWNQVLMLWISRKDIKDSNKSEFIHQLLNFTDHQKPYFYYYHTHLLVFSFILDGDLKDSDYKITEKVLSWYFSTEGSSDVFSTRIKILELIKNHPCKYFIQYLEGLLLKNKDDANCVLAIVDIFIYIEVENTQVIQLLLEIFMQDSSSEYMIYNQILGKVISMKQQTEFILNQVYAENCLVREHLLPIYEKELNILKNKEPLARKILKLNPYHQEGLEIVDNVERKRKSLLNISLSESLNISETKAIADSLQNEEERYNLIWGYFHDELMPCKKHYIDKYYWNRFSKNESYEQERQDFLASLNDVKLISEIAFLIKKTYDFYLDCHETNHPDLYELTLQSIHLDYELIVDTLILASEMLSLSESSHTGILSIYEKIFEDSLRIESLFNEKLMIEIGFYLARFSSEKTKYFNLLIQEVFYKAGIYKFSEIHLHYDHEPFYGDFLFDNIDKLIRKTLIEEPTLLSLTVQNLSKFISGFDEELNKNNDSSDMYYKKIFLYSILWFCSENMSYSDFYKAWHSQLEIIHPEILEISPLGNTSITQTLNQQILDLSSQLQPIEKTYPLVINAQSLEDETDNSSIAQELCNQIYTIVFPSETNIPEINNAPQLKRLIPNLKKQLNTQNLALIFHNGEPNESLTKFCKKLTDVIHIKWITEQPIAYGIPPQKNLVNILQNWINELD